MLRGRTPLLQYTEIFQYCPMTLQNTRILVRDVPDSNPGQQTPCTSLQSQPRSLYIVFMLINDPSHLHPWATTSPPMRHAMSIHDPSHLHQWAITSPPMRHYCTPSMTLHMFYQWTTKYNTNEPLHLHQRVTIKWPLHLHQRVTTQWPLHLH